MLELNEVYLGDCLEVMGSIDSGSVDMILCDLPYGITACKWDKIIPFEPLWKQYLRVIKKNGAIVLTASQPFTSALVMSNPKLFRYEWIWDKGWGSNFAVTKSQPFKEHESVLVFYQKMPIYNPERISRSEYSLHCHPKGRSRVMASKAVDVEVYGPLKRITRTVASDGLRCPKSIVQIKVEKNRHAGPLLHPNQKPVPLFEYFIKTYTNEGDLVLDNATGSGTTGIACLNTNRKFILIEKDPKFFEAARSRVLSHGLKSAPETDNLNEPESAFDFMLTLESE
jgi:site-specific DNA-methyltransferase (adenine-specific)